MTTIIDGTAGITFPNSTVQASSGVVLQVVNASTTTNSTTTSTSLVTTGFSASITPKFNTSKILVLVNIASYNGTTAAYQQYAVFRGATNITSTAIGYCAYSSSGVLATIIPIIVSDSPATVSATTYTLYFGASAGTTAFNPNTTSGILSTITLMEIAG